MNYFPRTIQFKHIFDYPLKLTKTKHTLHNNNLFQYKLDSRYVSLLCECSK